MKIKIIRFLCTGWLTILMMLPLYGCETQNLNGLEMILSPSTFSEQEVQEAFGSVREAFPQRFKNSDLISLVYSEDIQNMAAVDQDLTLEHMVISVTICGSSYQTSQDRAEYFCILNRFPEGEWFVHDWVLDIHSRPISQ